MCYIKYMCHLTSEKNLMLKDTTERVTRGAGLIIYFQLHVFDKQVQTRKG